MAAPKGNQFWRQRSKHGRDRLFASPELLWDAACEYFEWCDNHPWMTTKTKLRTTAGSSSTETENASVPIPYSLKGLCLYLGCSSNYFVMFKTHCNEDFLTILSCIEDIIETQQLNGATVGVYNANIVARKLGLADKQELTGANGTRLFDEKPLSKEELAKRMKELDDEV